MVDGAQRTIDFLTAVFDAQPLRMHPMGERLGHAEVRIDDTVLMLADGMDGWPPVASHVHLYVPDVDATWSRALAAGATPVQAPQEKGDGDIDVMRAIKHALDPNNIMNPGKVVRW